MKNSNRRIISALACLLLVMAVNGCDRSNPTASETVVEKGKWLDAPEALSVFQAAARLKASKEKTGPADTSCEAVIDDANQYTKRPDTPGFTVIALPCDKAKLRFGGELRCESGKLQAKCL